MKTVLWCVCDISLKPIIPAVVGGGALKSLDDLNVELEMLRSLLRVAYGLKFIKANSLGYIIKQIDEVGKMRGGWAKHYKITPTEERPV